MWLSRSPNLQAQPDPDPWWGRDKALHFGASAAIAGTTYGAAALLSDRAKGRASCVLWGVSVGLAAGLGKEAADLAGTGHASTRDLAWDVVGVAAGVAIAWAIDSAVGASARADDRKAARLSITPAADVGSQLGNQVGIELDLHVRRFENREDDGCADVCRAGVATGALTRKGARRLNLMFVGLKVFPRKPAASLTGGALLQ